MTPDLWLSAAAIVVLLVLSFFFSGSETSLTAASRARMHQLARSGDRRARLVEKLSEEKERLIGTILLGNNIVNILASTLAASILIALFGDAGIAYATIVMTAAIVIFCEVLPKTLALLRADAIALLLAPILRVFVIVLSPVTRAVQVIVNAVLRLFGLDARQAVVSGHDEIRGTVDLLHREGGVVKRDRDMLGGLLDLKELEVSDVMVHRTRMLTLDATLPARELVAAVLDSPYTRIPLHNGDPDEIVAVIHAKDVLRAVFKAGGDFGKVDIAKISTKPWFVPDTTSVHSQLSAFLKRKVHFAVVVNEYGDVRGLVTLEDILEEIVGDISDEHDEVMQGATKQPDGSYLIEGSLPIRDLNRALDWRLPDEEATTIAGLVIHEAKSIPAQGQQFTFHGFRIKVVRKARNRLTLLRVTPLREAGLAAE